MRQSSRSFILVPFLHLEIDKSGSHFIVGALGKDGEQGSAPVREGQTTAKAGVVGVRAVHECLKGDYSHAQQPVLL